MTADDVFVRLAEGRTSEPSPAIPALQIGPDGTQSWFLGGKLHRLDGPAVVRPNGAKHWYRHGLLHRERGPAVEAANGSKEWHLDGKLHRLDGPALWWEMPFGVLTADHYVLDTYLTPKEFEVFRVTYDEGAPMEWALAYAKGETS